MKRYLLLLILLLPQTVLARPVSYAGGWMVMQENDALLSAVDVTYSPTASYALGYTHQYWRQDHYQFGGAQLNYLAKRWNNAGSQGNIYFKSGLGIAYSDEGAFDGTTSGAGYVGTIFDWEDRRFYTSYENTAMDAGHIDKSFMQKARVGVAPYIGEYGDIHTWLMLQLDHQPEGADPYTLTPLVRMFKGTYLAEAGINNRGNVLLNITLQF